MNQHHGSQPQHRAIRLAAGSLLIVVPAAFTTFFTLLQMRFDYPDILRKPAAEVLARFSASEASLLPLWYGMFASAVLFMSLSLGVASLCPPGRVAKLTLATSGVLAGLVQAIGLSRWIFAVPLLASRFASADSPEERAVITTVFDTLNGLLGVGIGEHMGFMLTAFWTLTLAWKIRSVRPLTAAVGAVSAAGIAAGLAEPLHVPFVAAINAIGYTAWSLWLIWLGGLVLAGKPIFQDPR
jgi:hypothetical protein